jgi:hypothetical protein
MRVINYALAASVGLLSFGCASTAGDGGDGPVGAASVAIAKVPGDVTCIRLTATGTRTVTQDYPVASGASTVLALGGLPTGNVTFTGAAYLLNATHTPSCAGITASTVPDWVSDSPVGNVTVSSTVNVTLNMHHNGQSSVTVNFDDGDGGAADTGASDASTDASADASTDSATDGDAGAADASAADGDAATDAATSVRIESPVSGASTNGVVAVQVALVGAPNSIDLSVDGAVVSTLTTVTPFELDTRAMTEGSHVLSATAHYASGDVTSAPVTLIVDRTAPTISTHVPATGAGNVMMSAPITVTFSEPIAAGTVGSPAITLKDASGNAVPFASSLSTDGRTLSVSTTVPTDGATGFSLALAGTVTDLAGNALNGSTSFAWSTPTWVTLNGPTFAPIAVGATPTAYSVGANAQINPDGATFWQLSTTPTDGTSPAIADQLLLGGAGGGFTSVTLPTPSPLTGETVSFGGYSLGAADDLEAFYFYLLTGTDTVRHHRYSRLSWSGSAWAPMASQDPLLGFTDAAGNGYYAEPSSTGITFYRRAPGGSWAVYASETFPTGYRSNGSNLNAAGELMLVEVPSGTFSGTRNIIVRRFTAGAWVTDLSAPFPLDATHPTGPIVSQWFNGKLYVSLSYTAPTPAGSSTTPPTQDYVMTPGVGAWQLVGGGPVGGASYAVQSGDYPYPQFDRFNRLQVNVTDASGIPGLVQLNGSSWSTVILPPVVANAPTNDIGSVAVGTDTVGPAAFVEVHTAAAAGSGQLNAFARMLRLNR